MSIELIPEKIRETYEVHESKHACAILAQDFQDEWRDVMAVLQRFHLRKSHVLQPGGGKSPISGTFDSWLYEKGWVEKAFDTEVHIDGTAYENPTHKIDCYKNRVGIEIEWNNKDPFYDRDLNNFRILFDLKAISVGIIITRADELQELFDSLGKGKSYGSSTTHMSKLLPRLQGGGGGGCPVLVFGITLKRYVEDP